MSNLNFKLFSLWIVYFVFFPAIILIFCSLYFPENFLFLTATVFIFLFSLINLFPIIFSYFFNSLGNSLNIAISPIWSNEVGTRLIKFFGSFNEFLNEGIYC